MLTTFNYVVKQHISVNSVESIGVRCIGAHAPKPYCGALRGGGTAIGMPDAFTLYIYFTRSVKAEFC